MSAPPRDKNGQVRHPPAYAGFLAGVFSGITKLTVGHPYVDIYIILVNSS